MSKIIDVIDGAQFVVLLWFGAALLPILLFNEDASSQWSKYLGAAIIVSAGFFVTQLRKRKKSRKSWEHSDVAVYVLVPIFLIFFFTFASLSGTAT